MRNPSFQDVFYQGRTKAFCNFMAARHFGTRRVMRVSRPVPLQCLQIANSQSHPAGLRSCKNKLQFPPNWIKSECFSHAAQLGQHRGSCHGALPRAAPLSVQCFWFSHLCYTEMPAAALCGQKAAKPKEFHCWPSSQQRGQPQAMLNCALSRHTDSTSWGEMGKNPGFEYIFCLGSVNY